MSDSSSDSSSDFMADQGSSAPNSPESQLPVNLSLLLDELRIAQDDETLYLHAPTGQWQLISEEEVAVLGEVHDDMLPETEVEILDDLRNVLMSDDWLELPSRLPEEPQLKSFAATLADQSLGQRLQALLATSYGLSQSVLDFLYDEDLEASWETFQRQSLKEAIASRLQARDVPLTL